MTTTKRKASPAKGAQTSLDPKVLPLITKALENRQMKKARCPVCSWESSSYTPNWYSASNLNMRAMSQLKRHLRDKHRAYYQMAITKPFIIHEEEENQSWLLAKL